jgi:urease accessory protein
MKCKVTILAGYKNRKSYLKDSFFTRPFRVADAGLYKEDDGLYVMLMNSSPGILDTDEYDFSIDLEENSRLQMESQSYQRLFNMKTGAKQKVTVQLRRNCTFSYVPHPVVPHENSKFKNHTLINLADDCDLILSEIITCGRKLCGEVFRFSRFHNLTEVFYNDCLIFKDNIVLEPKVNSLNTIIQLESFTHQATFIFISTKKSSSNTFIQCVHDKLSLENDIIFGISEMAGNGFVLRVLGNGGEQLYDCFQDLQKLLWKREQTITSTSLIDSIIN